MYRIDFVLCWCWCCLHLVYCMQGVVLYVIRFALQRMAFIKAKTEIYTGIKFVAIQTHTHTKKTKTSRMEIRKAFFHTHFRMFAHIVCLCALFFYYCRLLLLFGNVILYFIYTYFVAGSIETSLRFNWIEMQRS